MRFGHAHDHDGDAPRMAGDGRSSRSSASAVSRHRMVELAPGPEPASQRKRGVLSRWWDSFTEFLRHPFRDCYNMCDLERPFGASPGSPGVTVLPQHFPRMDRDLKYDFTAGPISSSAASKSSPARSTRSKTSSDSFLSYDDPYDQPTQFLFYCGSDPLTPTSAQLAARNGLKTDTISGYTPTAGAEPQVHTPLASPRISHQIPVFFSPRNAPTSPAAAPLYSPHLFRITEREYDPYFMRYSR